MDALRDWGHAKDYVRMQWLMLQQDEAEDFVIATGKQISVRDFVVMSARQVGIELDFSGEYLSGCSRSDPTTKYGMYPRPWCATYVNEKENSDVEKCSAKVGRE